eukprot:4536364-Pyramimonas_sp.AAC.1
MCGRIASMRPWRSARSSSVRPQVLANLCRNPRCASCHGTQKPMMASITSPACSACGNGCKNTR